MKTRLIIKSVPSLTDTEYADCLKHNLGDMGMMKRRTIVMRGKSNKDSKAFMLRATPSGELLAWALAFRWDTEDYAAQSDGWNLYFYTHPDHRRMGYGRALYDGILTKFNVDELVVFGWNPTSKAFYRELGFDY